MPLVRRIYRRPTIPGTPAPQHLDSSTPVMVIDKTGRNINILTTDNGERLTTDEGQTLTES